jgi:hypothetical protein
MGGRHSFLYAYDLMNSEGVRVETHADIEQVDCNWERGEYVLAHNLLARNDKTIRSMDQMNAWLLHLDSLERKGVLPVYEREGPNYAADDEKYEHREKIAKTINPKHYQDYIAGMQWIEAMQHLPRFKKEPEALKGAIELQVRKYLDRCGGKDHEEQELKKALWYLKFLVAFVANDHKPIRVEEIDKILAR